MVLITIFLCFNFIYIIGHILYNTICNSNNNVDLFLLQKYPKYKNKLINLISTTMYTLYNFIHQYIIDDVLSYTIFIYIIISYLFITSPFELSSWIVYATNLLQYYNMLTTNDKQHVISNPSQESLSLTMLIFVTII
eukprot:UN01794